MIHKLILKKSFGELANDYTEWYLKKFLPWALKEILNSLPYFVLGWLLKKIYELKGIELVIVIGVTAGIYYLALISRRLQLIEKQRS